MSSASDRAFAVPEILAQIVDHTIFKPDIDHVDLNFGYNDSILPRDFVMTKDESPWPFLRVCNHWRHVVLSTPALWSTFILSLRFEDDLPDDVSQLDRIMPLLDEHLERSKNAPLMLVIRLTDDRRNAKPIGAKLFYQSLLERLIPTQHRWQDAILYMRVRQFPLGGTFTITAPRIPEDFKTLRLGNMKILKNLFVFFQCFPMNGGGVTDASLNIELGPCRSLERVTFSEGVAFRGLNEVSEDYFPQMQFLSTVISEESGKVGDGWKVLLQHAPSVKHLEIYNPMCSGPPVALASRVTNLFTTSQITCNLPNLRFMRIDSSNVEHVLPLVKLSPFVKLDIRHYFSVLGDDKLTDFGRAIEHVTNQLHALKFVTFIRHNQLQGGTAVFRYFLLSSCDALHVLSFDMPYHTFCAALAPALTAIMKPNRLPNETFILPRLRVFHLDVAVWLEEQEKIEDVDFSPIRDVILVLRQRYSSLLFTLSIFANEVNEAELDAKIGNDIRANTEILSSVTSDFGIVINGVGLKAALRIPTIN